MGAFIRRLVMLFRRSRLERDLDDELAFHLAMRQGEHGNTASRRQFGSVLRVKEQSRAVWLLTWLESLLLDIRQASRSLRRSPTFALTAIITLGIGITATTVIFSVVDSLLFNSAPFSHSDRLVEFLTWSPRGGGPMQPGAMLARWREQDHLFEQVEAHWEHGYRLTGGGEPEAVPGSQVTIGLLPMLGVAPALGRYFAPDEEDAAVALISHRLWQRRFAEAPDIVGRTMRMDNRVYTVVGVMPSSFRFPVSRVDVWIPFAPLRPNPYSTRGNLTPIARLRAGVPFDEADRQVAALALQLDPTLSSMLPGTTARLATMERYSTKGVRGAANFASVDNPRTRLFLLFGAAIVLLVLSAANAANLFLSRALARLQDLSIRVTLGAGRARVLRHMLVEALVVATAAAALGIGGAAWVLQIAATYLPIDLVDASLNPVNLDPRAAIWSALAAAASGILAALLPAIHLLRRDLSGILRGALDRSARSRLGSTSGLLVAVQSASAVILLVGAGLMARSLWVVMTVDRGWLPDGVIVVRPFFDGPYAPPGRRADYLSALSTSLRQQPEFRVVAIAEGMPSLPSAYWFGTLHAEGTEFNDAEVVTLRVSAEYFRALGLRFAHGRPFTPEEARQPVAVIGRSLARRLWDAGPAVGRRFRYEKTDEWLTVIGVVPDVEMDSLERRRNEVEIYRPLEATTGPPGSFQPSDPYRYIVLNTDGSEQLPAVIKQMARAIDPDLPVEVRSSREILRAPLAERELNTAFLIGFSLFGVLLAAAGIYALVAYDTSRRTHEIGVRVALGATAADIIRVIIRRSVLLSAVGAAIGLIAALGAARFMSSMVFGVSPYDAFTFGGAIVLLLVTSALAAGLPARRATQVDPLVALRCD